MIIKEPFDIRYNQPIGEILSYELNYSFEFELKILETHATCAQIIQGIFLRILAKWSRCETENLKILIIVGVNANHDHNGNGSLVVLFNCGHILEFSFHGYGARSISNVLTNDWNKV